MYILNWATFHNIPVGVSASWSGSLTDVFGNEEWVLLEFEGVSIAAAANDDDDDDDGDDNNQSKS